MIGNYENLSKNRKLTKTSKFILPLTVSNKNNIEFNQNQPLNNGTLYKSNFINAFICDLNNNEKSTKLRNIYIAYRYINQQPPDNIPQYKRFFNNQEYTIKKYTPSLQFIRDIELIIDGKYSQITQNAKERIKAFWENDKTICAILNATTINEKAKSILGMKDSIEIDAFNELNESLPEEIEYTVKIVA